jgi:amino-acid N-acetyltransferase
MTMTIGIGPATAAQFEAGREWLGAAGLPIQDLAPTHAADFLFATANGNPAGMIGLERFGHVGLLRSLIVDSASRGAGIGSKLVAALEATATQAGIAELWLLTVDADRYFESFGYAACGRDAAPDAIRATAEFSSLCPDSAVLMRKRLR